MPLYRYGAKIVFFVHIPKTGGSSIENVLRSLDCKQALYTREKPSFFSTNLQHMNGDIYRSMMDSDFYDYSFTVVRNPFDRAASEFKMKVVDAGADDTFDHWFPAAIDRYKKFPYSRDNHIRPQRGFVSKSIEVFKLEDGLDKPIAAACAALGLTPPTEPRHDRKGADGLIEAKAKTLARVASFYAKDFEKFGYPMDFSRSFRAIS